MRDLDGPLERDLRGNGIGHFPAKQSLATPPVHLSCAASGGVVSRGTGVGSDPEEQEERAVPQARESVRQGEQGPPHRRECFDDRLSALVLMVSISVACARQC